MAVKLIVINIVLVGASFVALVSPSYAETVSPRRLLEVVDLDGLAISPDGRQVAFRIERAAIERNTYDTAWYVQAADGRSAPRRLADGGIPLRDTAGISSPARAAWSPDGRWIFYRAMLAGRIDVWRAATDGSVAEPITLDVADVVDFYLTADGKTLTYSVGPTREEIIAAEQAEYDRGIRIDHTVAVDQSLFRSGYIGDRLATQRFGAEWFRRTSLLADVPVRWQAIDLTNGVKRDVVPSERPTWPTMVSAIPQTVPEPWKVASEPNNGRIAMLTRIGDGDGLLQKPDVQLAVLLGNLSGQSVICNADLCTGKAITGVQWRPDSDEVLFTVTDPSEGLAQSLYRWNVLTGKVQLVTRSSGQISGSRDRFHPCGVSRDAVFCVAADVDRPPRLERIDFDTGDRQVLFAPNAALAQDLVGIEPQLLHWADAKGREFTGQFFPARITDDRLPPLFVTYYRCSGFLRGGVGDEWPLISLAEYGISALCINSAPYRLDAVERYDLGLSAVQSAVDLLASDGKIDRYRVGMGGLSFGSEVTLWALMKADFLVAASITSALPTPNSYLYRSLRGDGPILTMHDYWQLGAPDETPERWRELSPVFNLKQMQEPILMQMPEEEYIQALEYSIPLIRSLRADLYVFPHAPHQKFQPRHKLAAYQRNLDWFRFWLQGYEDPDPAKHAQYAHWRLMRERNTER